jgi:osmotically-inducible protein OsmY
MIRGFILLGLLSLTSGCGALVVGAVTTTGTVIADERSTGQQVDDIGIYTQVNRRFLESDVNDLLSHVTINVRNGRVLLTGNVNQQATAERAIAEAWRVNDVQEVINEIEVRPEKGIGNNLNDALIKKNLEGRLFVTEDVMIINYSIDVVNGVAYLLGNVQDRAELDRVLHIARTTKGIKKVVSHLKIAPKDPVLIPEDAYPSTTDRRR